MELTTFHSFHSMAYHVPLELAMIYPLVMTNSLLLKIVHL
jgi:hypothetical protein